MFQVSQASLTQHFKEQGNITDVKLLVKDGKFKGCAFIGFEKPEQAHRVCDRFDNSYLNCNKITVELARGLSEYYLIIIAS